jgi:S1-C subfamily serine protease
LTDPSGWRALLRSFAAYLLALAFFVAPAGAADVRDTIARVKQSVVPVGTYMRGRSPAFQFRGTGFVVDGGVTVVTNAHVLPGVLDSSHNEILAIIVNGASTDRPDVRELQRITIDPSIDLAVLKLTGAPLPALRLRDSDAVREGQDVLITGFPLGAVLGPFAATHRGMISAITPIAIPQGRAADLNPALIHRLGGKGLAVFQLDATAYPGNSGSPIYDPDTGDVLGIVNMVFVKGTKEAALTNPSGITYAVPSNNLRSLLDTAR